MTRRTQTHLAVWQSRVGWSAFPGSERSWVTIASAVTRESQQEKASVEPTSPEASPEARSPGDSSGRHGRLSSWELAFIPFLPTLRKD